MNDVIVPENHPKSGLSDLFRRHRSIRSFKPDPIDPAIVDQVCEDAIIGASSSGNLNCVSLVLTRDPDRKRRLYEFHSEQEMVLEAPLVMTFCADWFRTREWLRRRGAKDNFNNQLGYHVAVVDATIVAQNVCLGFEALGLGICYMGTTLFRLREISEFLELPDTCVPVTTIVVGHPNEDPSKRDRLPTAAFLHDETYRQFSEEELHATYAQREVRGWERYMSMPAVRELIESKGITSLAQFYTSEVKYDPDFFREQSDRIMQLLEEKHFLP
jgi:nitroreductase